MAIAVNISATLHDADKIGRTVQLSAIGNVTNKKALRGLRAHCLNTTVGCNELDGMLSLNDGLSLPQVSYLIGLAVANLLQVEMLIRVMDKCNDEWYQYERRNKQQKQNKIKSTRKVVTATDENILDLAKRDIEIPDIPWPTELPDNRHCTMTEEPTALPAPKDVDEEYFGFGDEFDIAQPAELPAMLPDIDLPLEEPVLPLDKPVLPPDEIPPQPEDAFLAEPLNPMDETNAVADQNLQFPPQRNHIVPRRTTGVLLPRIRQHKPKREKEAPETSFYNDYHEIVALEQAEEEEPEFPAFICVIYPLIQTDELQLDEVEGVHPIEEEPSVQRGRTFMDDQEIQRLPSPKLAQSPVPVPLSIVDTTIAAQTILPLQLPAGDAGDTTLGFIEEIHHELPRTSPISSLGSDTSYGDILHERVPSKKSFDGFFECKGLPNNNNVFIENNWVTSPLTGSAI